VNAERRYRRTANRRAHALEAAIRALDRLAALPWEAKTRISLRMIVRYLVGLRER